jgi:membrane-associated HD superfamily phosphohydrolase
MATKRLMDGQFDDCELTLRDLNLIVESVSRTVSSMCHSRIAYPDRATKVG